MPRIGTGRAFDRELKELGKKYWSLDEDYEILLDQLAEDPLANAHSLGKSCYKIRMAIASKGKGKSGGARVIAYIKIVKDRVVLLSIYDKSEKEDLEPGRLKELLEEEGLA